MALQDTRHLVQISRQSLQEASLRLKEDNVDSGLNQALKGCLVALRAAEVRKKSRYLGRYKTIDGSLEGIVSLESR